MAVGVAGEVEPVAGPAFAVLGASQEAVDDGGEGLGGRIRDEGGQLFGRRGEAGEVNRNATEESAFVGGDVGGEAGLFTGRFEVVIDLDRGGLRERGESPEGGHGGAVGDPTGEVGDLIRG